MDKQNKILVQYKPSEIDVFLSHKDSKKQISEISTTDEISLQEARKKLYELITNLQKKYKLIPIEISIQLSSNNDEKKNWEHFINEFFATTGATIGLSKK